MRFPPPYIENPWGSFDWEIPLSGQRPLELAPGESIGHEERFEISTACPAMYQVICSAEAEPAPYVNRCLPWTFNYDPSSWEEQLECDSGNLVGIHIDPERESSP